MSILPISAQHKLSPYQVTALDQRYRQDTSLIASATSAPVATGDTLFVSLDAHVALDQYETTKGQPTADLVQSQDASIIQSMTGPAALPSFGFTSTNAEAQLLQFQASQQK